MPLTELMTFKVTKEMKDKMKKFSNINWSAWIRIQIHREIERLEKIERESPVNFCARCGERLSTPTDIYCRMCGTPIPKMGAIRRPP